MNDVQFIVRLHSDLQDHTRWPEIQQVQASTTAPALAANELLVYAESTDTAEPLLLRLTVESLIHPPGAVQDS